MCICPNRTLTITLPLTPTRTTNRKRVRCVVFPKRSAICDYLEVAPTIIKSVNTIPVFSWGTFLHCETVTMSRGSTRESRFFWCCFCAGYFYGSGYEYLCIYIGGWPNHLPLTTLLVGLKSKVGGRLGVYTGLCTTRLSPSAHLLKGFISSPLAPTASEYNYLRVLACCRYSLIFPNRKNWRGNNNHPYVESKHPTAPRAKIKN